MDAYIYNADIECEACAVDRIRELQARGVADNGDSNIYPQGPYANGGGEADTPQHCGSCGLFLDNPLTEDGSAYVKSAWRAFVEDGRGHLPTLLTWSEAYNNEWSEFDEQMEDEVEANGHTDLAVRRLQSLMEVPG